MSEPFDITRARTDTPGCQSGIHLNSAGASLAPTTVLEVVTGYLREEALVGGYELARRRDDELEGVYASAAAFIGARPDEIAYMDSASRAWACALTSIGFRAGDRILVSSVEYSSSVIALLGVAERTAVSIEVIPDDEFGQVDAGALEQMLDERVALVAVTHVPTNSGLVNPVGEVGRVIHRAGADLGHAPLYLVDACQSLGQIPLDVDEIGCDLLSATGRKFLRAPRGTGLLYARRERLDQLHPPVLDQRGAHWESDDRYRMRDDARRFETWERGVATMLGFGAALDYAKSWGIDAIGERSGALAATLRRRLDEIDGVHTHDPGLDTCAIVTFTVDGREPDGVAAMLADHDVHVWTSPMSSAPRDFARRGLPEGVVRASPHYFNTEEELDVLATHVGQLAR